MTGDQQSERLDQDEDADNVERFRVLVGARLARLGVPMTVTTLDDDHEIEKRYDIDRLRVEVGVPLVRRPIPATHAAEVVDVSDDDVEDRGNANGRQLR